MTAAPPETCDGCPGAVVDRLPTRTIVQCERTLLTNSQPSRSYLLLTDPEPSSAFCDPVELGDFCSGTARSITRLGGCLPASRPSSVDFSGGIARSIAAVGGCLV